MALYLSVFQQNVGLEYFDLLEEFKVNKNSVPFENFIDELLNKEYDRMIEMINRYKK